MRTPGRPMTIAAIADARRHRPRSERATARDELEDHDHHRDDQQQMDETARDVEREEAEQPEHDEDGGDGEQHG